MNVKNSEHLTLAEARYLALAAQGLETPSAPAKQIRPAKSDLLALIDQGTVIQLDSISVISRTHETVLWSRLGDYDVSLLAELHYPDAELFEGWAHAASLLPVAALPYMKRKMLLHRDPAGRDGEYLRKNRDLLDHVLATVRDSGPLSTRAFERPEGKDRQRWEWYGGKPAKEALDFLWYSGELMIQRRIGFERVYDLTERVFPGYWEEPLPSIDAQDRFFVGRGLRAVGVGTLPWIADYFHDRGRFVEAKRAKQQLSNLEHEGLALPTTIEGIPGHAWIDARLIDTLDAFRGGHLQPSRSTLLSPFDNLLWRRQRALALFGYDYRIETYTPEPLRQYGYYSLTILHRGQLIGRLDPRFKRKLGLLSIESVHLEPWVKPSADIADGIAWALRDLLRFLGGNEISITKTSPERLGPMLRRRIGG